MVIYLLDSDGELKHNSICFIYEVQTLLAEHVCTNYLHINKFLYFSDGCAGRYKNYNIFINLCHHKQDFGLDAEWTFFATRHRMSPCDGICGFVKRYVAK